MKLEWVLEAEAESTGTTGSPSTPSETPSETTPSEFSEAAEAETEGESPIPAGEEESPVDWDSLIRTEEEEQQAEEERVKAAEPAATPEPAPVAEPAAVEAPKIEPAVAAPVPQEPVALAPVAEPQAPQKTQAQIDSEAAASYAQYEKQLTEHYKIPEDLMARYETEPETVLPILAARMHIGVVNEVMARMQASLPKAFTEHQQIQQREEQARSAFFSKWPQLKDKDEAVFRVGAMFRAANPSATHEQAIDGVGKMACLALGIPFEGAAPAAAAPAAGAPRSPFRPATPGGAGPAPPPKETNPFAQLAEEFLDEDLHG